MTDRVETQLVRAAFSGDIESFGKLAERHYGCLVAIGYSILSDRQLAEDAAQESLARALVRLRGLKDKRKFAPWLAAICRNVARDMLAAKSREIDSTRYSEVSDRGSCDDCTLAVQRAIGELAADEKELVALRYYDDLPYEKICTVLGISKGAINGRLTRVKRKIAKYLKRGSLFENQI